jgi:alpha-galactosidase
MKVCIAAVGMVFALLPALGGEFNANGCKVEWNDRTVTVGNSLFSKKCISIKGRLQTASFRTLSGTEWQTEKFSDASADQIAVAAEKSKWSPVGVEGIRVEVSAAGITNTLYVFSGMPGVISICPPRRAPAAAHDLDRDVYRMREWCAELRKDSALTDHISYGQRHVKVTSVICADQTDIRDQLLNVDERLLMTYDTPFTVAATSLDLRDVLTGEGIVFVRIAPMPLARPGKDDDFIVDGSRRKVAALANGYPLAELVYSGGEAGRQRAVVAFQRAIRPYRPGRDGVLLSNTWGAGNRDSRICQEFLLKEIDAGAKMGVDVIQIDDGWQRGRTANSKKKAHAGTKKVWSGYWAADPLFWTADRERFPDGLEFLVGKAKEKGMRFGLWFGPDSSDEAANWERDADCLLDLHRRLGIDYFKMDSMKLNSSLALKRNRMMFDKMLRESGGAMAFDLDCTAEVRPGFFGLIDIGPLFVENRYTRRPIYWPHHTLKNLWDLSHLIDPVRLRFEFNNPDTNHDNYSWSPLGHGKYRPDALFATVMAASPLAWMELSDVSEKSSAEIASLVRVWKRERDRWYGGVMHPVGNRPDGVAWTGFVSESMDGSGGYVLLFRELNPSADFTLDLSSIFGKGFCAKAEVIAGRGDATVTDGCLKVSIPEKLDYIWVRCVRN